ncbi:hypothetical protein BDF20DRAFT_16185 [Mycotypha africana]|uniref:uncharacterized protein n=1 Tax=Mycotypha africana TaxID=64632 RepID=UPI0023009BB3|nr:uncharacterized protein BDF20DRAFT_16185 [Mycotypha africana]KAI8991010.1 hypothetical protein BDF20DRAFT_16185 [Mycotypha africana]
MGNTTSVGKRKLTAHESRSRDSKSSISKTSDRDSYTNTQNKYDRHSQIVSNSSFSMPKKPKQSSSSRKLSSIASTPTQNSSTSINMIRRPSSSSSFTANSNSVLGDRKENVQKLTARSPPPTNITSSMERVQYFCRLTPRASFSTVQSPQMNANMTAATDYFSTNISSAITPPPGLCRRSSSRYCLPADDHEQDRLTNTHYVIKHCFGDNFSAPVHDLLTRSVSMAYSNNNSDSNIINSSLPNLENTLSSNVSSTTTSTASSVKNCNISTTRQSSWLTTVKVLDVACGSGVWVLDMASHYPNSHFYGIDCAPLFPSSIKPPNAYFQQCNVLEPEGLPFPDEYFDYVHMRLVYNSFSADELRFVLNEINRVLKPGGYVELRDVQPYLKNPGPITDSIFSVFPDRMQEIYGVDITWTNDIPDILAKYARLTDIHYQEANLYYGGEGPLATAVNACLTDPFHSYKDFFLRAYHLTPEEYEETKNSILKEYTQYRSYLTYCMGWGRKPLVAIQPLMMLMANPTIATNSITPIPTPAPTPKIYTTTIAATARSTAISNHNTDVSIPSADSTSLSIPNIPTPSKMNDSSNTRICQAAAQTPPLYLSNTAAPISTAAPTTATTTPLLSPNTSTNSIMNIFSNNECNTIAENNSTDEMESFILENVFDIAHLTDGFTE